MCGAGDLRRLRVSAFHFQIATMLEKFALNASIGAELLSL
jgi:hypothetical protein